MEFDSPIGRRCAGQSEYQETKWHGAVGRLSADGRAQDGTMGQLELQTVRRHPQHVTPAEGRPDGSEEKANEQRLGRRRGRVQHLAFQPHNKGQRKRQALPALGRGGGDSKSPTDSCRRDCKAGRPAVLAMQARALSGPVARPCLLIRVASQSCGGADSAWQKAAQECQSHTYLCG